MVKDRISLDKLREYAEGKPDLVNRIKSRGFGDNYIFTAYLGGEQDVLVLELDVNSDYRDFGEFLDKLIKNQKKPHKHTLSTRNIVQKLK